MVTIDSWTVEPYVAPGGAHMRHVYGYGRVNGRSDSRFTFRAYFEVHSKAGYKIGNVEYVEITRISGKAAYFALRTEWAIDESIRELIADNYGRKGA